MKLNKEDLPQTNGNWYRGSESWYSVFDEQFHNSLGPAVIIYDDGTKEWFMNNQLHRLDGPAVEYANGHNEWWVAGVQYDLQKDFAPAVIKFLFAFDDNTFLQIIINEIKRCVTDDNINV